MSVPAPLAVLKFGSSVLATAAALPEAVHEIYRWRREGYRVVAVVSAFAGVTDARWAGARNHDQEADPHTLAGYVALGEAETAQALALALGRAGLPAPALDPWHTGLRVQGDPLDAEPIALDATPLLWRLEDRPIAITPGFVGSGARGLCLLGRGGSDLSALFLAARLGAQRCVLLKDVDGLYERDPSLPGPKPRRFAELGWEDALRLDGGIVQHKAVRFAAAHGLAFEVGAPGAAMRTLVGPYRQRFTQAARPSPLRVALIGAGVVGGGVAEALRRQPDRFELVGVAARTRGMTPAALLAADFDVLVELSGAVEAGAWIRRAFALGRDVVTAHKELLAREGEELEALARAHGARLRYSAAVGGAAPLIESVSRGRVSSFTAILNGTTQFVLGRVERGVPLAAAIAEARTRGYCEADPARDLAGEDACAKLRLLVRAAFGTAPEDADIPRVALDATLAARAAEVWANGGRLRLVAHADRAQASLRAVALSPQDPLAGLAGAECGVRLERADGSVEFTSGRGAGRWPTAEAVLADLWDLQRARAVPAGPLASKRTA